MNKEQLSDAINEIDEEMIDSAAQKRVKPAVGTVIENAVPAEAVPETPSETTPEAATPVAAAPEASAPVTATPEAAAPAGTAPEAPVKRKKPIFAWFGGIAAAAAAIVAGVVFLPKLTNNPVIVDEPVQTTAPFVTTTAPAETTATQTTVSATDGEPDDSADYFKTLTSRERPGSSIVADVSAVTSTDGYIMTDTAFKIDVKGDVSEDTLRSHLTLGSGSEYTLERGDDGSFLLTASAAFERGDTVKLSVSDDSGEICDSYAFVTMDEFKVKTTYPYDGSSYTERDSGVEIEFTCAPDVTDAASYFSISPAVDGEFTAAKNRLVFYHDTPFEPMTEYTVTLKAGLRSVDGQALAEDKVFTFTTTAHDDGTYFYTGSSNSGFSESFIPGDQAFVEIYCSDNLRNNDYQLHLYSFDTADAYYEAVKARMNSNKSIDTSGLTEVYSSLEKPYTRSSDAYSGYYGYSVYVLLPEDLAEGYYIADISVDYLGSATYSLQYMVEVTPISVYSLSLGEENLFYVNNSATGAPASGAEVTLDIGGTKYSAKTDSDGLAKVDTKGETGRSVLNVTAGGKRFMDAFVLTGQEDMVYDDLYYSYIYTDRELYLTTDTIKVWGVLIPKAHNTALPSGLKVVLGDMYLGGGEEKAVTVSKNGTFSAEFSYKNHTGTYSSIYLKTGDDIIVSKSVGIYDYVKPDYIVEMTAPEYAVLPQYDPVEVNLEATYYEGTPAEGLTFAVSGSSNDTEYVTTDEDGKATAKLKLKDYGYNDWCVCHSNVTAELTGVENTYLYKYRGLDSFFRDVMLQYKLNDNNDLTIYTNKIDFDKIDEYYEKRNSSEYADKNPYTILRGAPCNTEVSIVIKHNWTEKEETGSYYDYLEKKTVTTYKYTDQTTRVAAYKVFTEDGKYTLRSMPFIADHGRYIIEMSYADTNGDPVEVSVSVVMGSSGKWTEGDVYGGRVGNNSNQIYYTIDMNTGMRSNDYANYHKFSEDEEFTFSLRCSDSDRPVDGKLLIALYRSDFIEYKVYDMSKLGDIPYTASRALIPDANFEGAYFDGRHIYKADGGIMYYDPTERGLNIEAVSDKEKYDAGDTAKITVKVTDKDGKAVNGATVQLSCVDEAAFAMAPQDADILDGLYGYIWYPSATGRSSYISHEADNGFAGEKGGGGESGTRREFMDTAYFGEAVTDANGTATFTVKLPDNLTTWRATLFSLYDTSDDKLLAGTELLPVVVSRDMIITPITQTTYTEGDDIAVSAKCAGLPAGGKITVRLYGAGADKEIVIKPKDTANFGKLPAGEYTVTFITDGDSVEQKIKVTASQLETDIVRGADLADIIASIDPTRYPVTIAFFDKEYMFNTQILQNLACYCGQNLGMRLASAYAAVQFGYMTEQELIDEFMPETSSSLARELPNAETSIELTALMCAAVPDAVNRDYLIPMLKSNCEYLPSDRIKEKCASRMALAALGENVLIETRALLASGEIEDTAAGIYLAAALAFCGDYDSAYAAYIRYVPKVTFDDSDPDDVKAFITASDGDRQELTRTALIAASLLDMPEAETFARYLISVEPQYDSYGLQLVTYLAHYVPKTKGDAVFSYNRNGLTETVKLNRHRPTVITFTEEQLKNADFSVQSGAVYAVACYVGRVTDNPELPTLKVVKRLSGSYTAGKKITVTIQSAPNSIIYDVIPSCGRPAFTPGSYYTTNGQQIILYTDKEGKASYEFTVSLSGEFVLESAVALDINNGVWGLSERGTIKTSDASTVA